MRLVEGPFRHLEGAWDFQTLGEKGSKITFKLAFEFKNTLLSMAIGPLFHSIASTMVQAFTDRAHQIYAS
jgi:ribosome-associated toxin RatA of RatAB toxin-antitoxin module